MKNSSPYDSESDENEPSNNRPRISKSFEIPKNLIEKYKKISEINEMSSDASYQELGSSNQTSIINSLIEDSMSELVRGTNDLAIQQELNVISDNLNQSEPIISSDINSSLAENDLGENSLQENDEAEISVSQLRNESTSDQNGVNLAINRFSSTINDSSIDSESVNSITFSTNSINETDANSSANISLPLDRNLALRWNPRKRSLYKKESENFSSGHNLNKNTTSNCGCFQGLTGIGIQKDSQKFCYIDSKNPDNILKGLNELRLEKSLCDIVLKVKDEEFYCHKCVLASISNYFRAMFNSNMAESKQREICLNGLEPQTMNLIIEYAYTSNLKINESNVQALLSSSNLFDIKPLREACCRYMEWKMDDQNCIGIYCFSDTHCCNELKEIAFKYILWNFNTVVKHEEFLGLNAQKLIDIIKSDNLNVPSEDPVYEACIKWLEYSKQERIPIFHTVLEHIRLPQLKPYFLYDKVQDNQYLKNLNECNNLIKEAFDYNFLKERRNQLQNKRTRSRKFFKHLESLIIICGENDEYVLRTVEAYIPSLESWLGLRNFPFSLTKSGVATSEETILYIAGGERSDMNATDSFWQYNSILDEWKELQNLHSQRSELGLAVVNGCIYAVGGRDLYGTTLKTVECYDPSLNIWKDCTEMEEPVANPAVCSLNGLLYVISESFCQYFNPISNTWKQFKKPQYPRSGSRACGTNGKIYLIGGYTTQTTNMVECYDPVEDIWEPCAPMYEARRHPGIAVLNNQIFVCGGETSTGEVSNTIEAYDLEMNKWSFVTYMRKERSWLSCATLRLENPGSNECSSIHNKISFNSNSTSTCQ